MFVTFILLEFFYYFFLLFFIIIIYLLLLLFEQKLAIQQKSYNMITSCVVGHHLKAFTPIMTKRVFDKLLKNLKYTCRQKRIITIEPNTPQKLIKNPIVILK